MSIALAFVGVGGIAKRHLATLQRIPEARVVAVCDLDLDRARAVAAEQGATAFGDFREMYDRARPDAVVVCVPPFAHGQVEVEAAVRGIHLFVEKPVALTAEVAAEVLDAVTRAGIITQVGYMYRLCRSVARVREVMNGRTIVMLQGHYFAGGMPAKSWWPRMDGSGGQLIEQATHVIDLARFLAGEVTEVVALTAQVHDWTPPPGWEGPVSWQTHYAERFEIPDVSALILRFASGALGTLSCAMTPLPTWTNGLTIVADGARAHIAGPVPDVSWETADGSGELAAEDGWSGQILREFVRAVAEGGRTSIPYVEGVRSLAVSLAAYESAAQGGVPVAADSVSVG